MSKNDKELLAGKADRNEYTADSIKVLEGLEGVRKRPAMYIGSTNSAGLHHLVYEVVDNSVDEALAGYCTHVVVKLHSDGTCSVEDNGRGIPVDIHPTEKISAAEVVLTKLHAGGKFSKDSYKYSGGLHGVGVSVVNALSDHLDLTIFKHGKIHHQEYRRGLPQYRLKETGTTEKRGTVVRFRPDPTIFETVAFQFDILASRFRELAFLNKGLRIDISEETSGQEQSFFFEGGITSFIQHINAKKTPLFPEVIEFSKDDGTYVIDFACQYNETYSEQTYSFVNNIRTTEGGTHEAGFKSALTKICNRYADALKMLKDESLSSDDVREGLVAVLSVKVPEPQFEGQTKTKLGNSDIKGIVDSALYAFFDTYFEENPQTCKKILQKALLAQQARTAAKKARELTRRKNVLESSVLPGKLADCSDANPINTELFIVEGDSAGGSAKQGRNRFTQAVLPLRGKIINVEKARMDRMLANNEIKDLITAIGAGIGEKEFNTEKTRYHKVIIMTDADVDGAHIRILLLTFFFRHMQPLIEKGYLYIAQPPLYKVKVGKTERYLQNESELKQFLFDWACDQGTLAVNGKPLAGADLQSLYKQLIAYDTEIEHASNLFEVPFEHTHELIKFWAENRTKLDKNNSAALLDALKPVFINHEITLHEFKEREADAGMTDAVPVREYFLFTQGKRKIEVPATFFRSSEIDVLVGYLEPLMKLDKSSWQLTLSKGTAIDGAGIRELSHRVIDAGKAVMTLQRYKGLGEMNPEQLWETTMNPDHRNLLQVSIEDAIKADQWFTSLMGDAVEDRRSYIERHATFVKNLDV